MIPSCHSPMSFNDDAYAITNTAKPSDALTQQSSQRPSWIKGNYDSLPKNRYFIPWKSQIL